MYVVGLTTHWTKSFKLNWGLFVEMKVVSTWSWIHIPYPTIQIGNPMAMIKSSCHLELSFWGRERERGGGGVFGHVQFQDHKSVTHPPVQGGSIFPWPVLWSKDRMVGGLTNHRVRGHLWELLSVKFSSHFCCLH